MYALPRSTVAFTLGLLAMVWTGTPLIGRAGPASTLLERVNEVRAEAQLIPLAHSDPLADVALRHAEDMVRHKYMDHVDPAGRTPLDRVQEAGIEGFHLLAENLGVTSAASDRLGTLIDAWLGSPSHRENLLNPAFNTTGVAVVRTPDGHTLAVQLFATF
jgi:uncharacterized protein YkwD